MSSADRNKFTLVLAAGAVSDEINLGAEWYLVASLEGGTIDLRLNRGEWVDTFQGDNQSGGVDFIQLRNNSNEEATIVIRHGRGEAPRFSDTAVLNVTATLNAQAKAKATPIFELVSNASKTFENCISLSIYNSGTGSITVNNVSLGEGETVIFAKLQEEQLYSNINVDATGANKQATVTGSK